MSAPAKTLPRPGSVGAWILAIRPKTLSASIAPVIVGAAIAQAWWVRGFGGYLLSLPWQHGPGSGFSARSWLRLLAIFAVALGIQIGTNLVNDVTDHLKGADTHERLGPPRVTNLGLLAPREVVFGAIASFAVATGAGVLLLLALADEGRQVVLPLVLGVLAVGCGVLYTVGPASIAYLGLGEIFVLGFFGVFATAGTTLALTGHWERDAMVAGLAMGFLATGILEANNIRDIGTDAPVGKRTLAVRIGDPAARKVYVATIAAAFVCAALVVPSWGMVILAAVCGPLAWRAVAPVLDGATGRDLIKVLQANSLLELVFGVVVAGVIVVANPVRPWGML